MKTTTKERTLAIVEGAVMVAFAVVLDFICSWLPLPRWPAGGTISVAAVPIIFYAYRRGAVMGLLTAFVWSLTQLIIGPFYVPPAGTVLAIVLCALLDYLLAFTLIGSAPLFSNLFGRYRMAGYAVGAAAACLLRFLCSFVSGAVLFGSYAEEGMNVWLYSLVYNGGYMLPNLALAVVVVPLLCIAIDPRTLRPYKRSE